jgi:hypothetical protein
MAKILSPKLMEANTGQLFHWCPGCKMLHAVYVDDTKFPVTWKWNQSIGKPTFSPSVLVFPNDREHRCHYFVNEGMLEFLTDCHHELKGQKVPMPDIPADELW